MEPTPTEQEYMTLVIFRIEKDGEVIALLPEEAVDENPFHCACYVHVGQHSSANPSLVIRNTRPVREGEADRLRAELARLGYRLREGKRLSQKSLTVRREQLRAWREGN